MSGESFLFGAFELRPDQGQLLRDGRALPLGSRAFAILDLLVRAAPGCVSNRDILAAAWPGLLVEDANLRVQIATLRKAMGEGHAIANRPGQGYVLNAAVRRQTRLAETAAQAAGPGARLPALVAPLIGRAEVVEAVARRLLQRRFVTLAGPGGVGKTSLALAAAWTVAGHYPDGAVFVDLAPLTAGEQVVAAVAAALSLRLMAAGSLPELVAGLRRQRLLLLLDNCEHVIDAAAELAEALLKGAPGLHVLATSREALRAQGESLHRLEPLPAPPPDSRLTLAAALRYPAVALFVERAMVSQSGFTPTDAEARQIAELCWRLDGIPLAIELAAARMDMLDVSGLLARLSDRLTWLTQGRRTALPRHRTLRATLDWSFDLLPPAERRVLARLALLRGLFTIEDAVAIAAGDGLDEAAVVDGLAELIAKSLVVANLGDGQASYRLLDSVREHAAGKLRESGELPATAHRHAALMQQALQRLAAPPAAPRESLLAEYRRRVDDLRTALDWCFQPGGDLALGVGLTTESQPVWYQLSLMDEYRRHAERAIAATKAAPAPDAVAEMRLLVTVGPAVFNVAGSVPVVEEAFGRALVLARRLGDLPVQRRALWGLWLYRFGIGDYAGALELATRFGELVRGDDPTFMFDRIKALSHLYRGELATARAHAEQVLDQAEARSGPGPCGYQYEQRVVTEALYARALWLQGFPDRALEHATRSVEDGRASGHMLSLCFSLTLGAGPVALWRGDAAGGQHAAAELLRLAAEHALPFWDRHGRVLRQAAARLAGEPGEADADFLQGNAWNIGHAESIAAFDMGFALPEGFARFDEGPVIWCSAEILRLEARRCLRLGAQAQAETLLHRAMAIAQAQGALSWQLRIALTQAALLRARARPVEARALVAAALDRFTEGFDTADLRAARAVLAEEAPAQRPGRVA